MTPLSAVIITFNEERNIGRCLESLRGVADEIVVIDSHSTDQTRNICEKFEVRFLQNPFEDYASQKNFGNRQAIHRHILSLDADEALSGTLRDSIIAWKKSGSSDAARMNRLTSFCGQWIRHGGWYPDTKIRVFDKTCARWAGEKVHEFLEVDPAARVALLSGDLLHYSFYSIRQHLDTINKYSELKAGIMFAKGKRAGTVKLLLSPPVRFLRDYFFKKGFRDGFYGFVIAANSSYSVFLKYIKLRSLHRNKDTGALH